MREVRELTGIPGVDLKVKRPTSVDAFHPMPLNLSYAAKTRGEGATREELGKAYIEDGYFHRAILRYVQLGFSNGYSIQASTRVARYLENRLQIAANLDNTSIENFCKQMYRDYCIYGTCTILKARSSEVPSLNGFKLVPNIAAGLFIVPPYTLSPVYDELGNLYLWEYRGTSPNGSQVIKQFPLDDVILLTYDKESDGVFGTPAFIAAIPDIMVERQIEDSIVTLVYKYPNPMIHIETPGLGPDGKDVSSEDMDRIANMIRNMSSDTALITAPGQKVTLLGAESRALRMESYLTEAKKRVFASLGLNSQMIGETPSNQKDIELDRITRDQAMDFSSQFCEQFSKEIFGLFLGEAGIRERATFVLQDPDPLYKIKVETHLANLYSMNILTEDEVREAINRPEMTEEMFKRTYFSRVKLPTLTEPIKLQTKLSSYVKTNSNPSKIKAPGSVKPPANQHQG